jgi:hypothetical protein
LAGCRGSRLQREDAWDRFNDCVKELNAIRSEADKIAK